MRGWMCSTHHAKLGMLSTLLLHLVGVLVNEVLVLFLVLVVLFEVLRSLGEVDVATACAPAHDVLLVDLLHVVLVGLLDLLGAGLLHANQHAIPLVLTWSICATHLTALRVILVVIHALVGGLTLALLDRRLDRGVVDLVLAHVLVLDGVAHVCGGGVVLFVFLVISGVKFLLKKMLRLVPGGLKLCDDNLRHFEYCCCL
jgi:hypothetical protein